MENHPIPQDVTGFQFKLIGNMTIKQFAYLAIGVVSAWIFLQFPIIFILKFPLAAFFAILGVSFAFLPIEGRPMDVMIGHFVRALFAPTQFVYQKTGGQLYIPNPVSLMPLRKKELSKNPKSEQSEQSDKLKVYLSSFHHAPKNILDDKEEKFISNLSSLTSSPPAPKPKAQPSPIQSTTPPPATTETQNKIAANLAKDIEDTKKKENQLNKQSEDFANVHKRVTELEQKLQEVLNQKEEMAQQLVSLREKVNLADKKVFVPGVVTPKQQTKNVKQIPKTMGKIVGMPISPSVPNLITGIIKDPRGNALPNILVEVLDKDNSPVRAFKTNELGRFISATPLVNGVYTIRFEDPKSQNKFDAIEINVKGDIIAPIEVISLDTREELRQSLFSKT